MLTFAGLQVQAGTVSYHSYSWASCFMLRSVLCSKIPKWDRGASAAL